MMPVLRKYDIDGVPVYEEWTYDTDIEIWWCRIVSRQNSKLRSEQYLFNAAAKKDFSKKLLTFCPTVV